MAVTSDFWDGIIIGIGIMLAILVLLWYMGKKRFAEQYQH
jgi:hypothetical protein